jgi:hypothetical protein
MHIMALKYGRLLAEGQLMVTVTKIKMLALATIRENGHVDFISSPIASSCIY